VFRTVIFATDGSETADRALPYAKELARGEGRSLVVVHSRELLHGRAGRHPVLADEDDLVAKIAGQVDEARSQGIDATFRVVSGSTPHAANMVADVARDAGADVIVVGTRGHAPVAGLLLGSVTQRLLHIAPCPVLAVPAGKHAAARDEARETVAPAGR
jgi:nucleotide-binding universal stress UspA family protein